MFRNGGKILHPSCLLFDDKKVKVAMMPWNLASNEFIQISDVSVVSFQKTAVAVLASVAVFFKTAVVLKLMTAVVVIT